MHPYVLISICREPPLLLLAPSRLSPTTSPNKLLYGLKLSQKTNQKGPLEALLEKTETVVDKKKMVRDCFESWASCKELYLAVVSVSSRSMCRDFLESPPAAVKQALNRARGAMANCLKGKGIETFTEIYGGWTMDHKSSRINISSYLSGDLPDKEAEDFEIHSLNCMTCRDALLFQKTVDLCIKDLLKLKRCLPWTSLDMELFLKEIQKDQTKDAKVPLVELIKDKLAGLSKRWNIIERIEFWSQL